MKKIISLIDSNMANEEARKPPTEEEKDRSYHNLRLRIQYEAGLINDEEFRDGMNCPHPPRRIDHMEENKKAPMSC